MVLNPDFKEFIALLNHHNVRYLIVGGYAVAFHGHPRYTKDLDVWIDPSPANADLLLATLADFGFASLHLQQEDFTQPEKVVQLGYPPCRIDLLTSIDGLSFDEAYSDSQVIQIEGVHVHFIGLAALKKNKQTAGRYQDLADLEKLND